MANKPGKANFFPDVPEFPSMGTFQPVYGKFDLTTYIQGASDYEIMAFLVGKYNACLEAYDNITKLSADTITACKQLQDWINSWFTNLDVQEEINKKLDSMVADGSFGTLLHQTFDTQINQQTTSAVTAWLVANVTPAGSAVVVDKSLSIEGAAADAKATGEQITTLKNNVNNLYQDKEVSGLDLFIADSAKMPINISCNDDVFISGGNLIQPLISGTTNGITMEVDSDGSVSLTGTASDTASFVTSNENKFYLPAGTYTLKAHNPKAYGGVNIRLLDNYTLIGDIIKLDSINTTATINVFNDVTNARFMLTTITGVTLNTFKLKPQLYKGTSQNVPYVPYTSGIKKYNGEFSIDGGTVVHAVSGLAITAKYAIDNTHAEINGCNLRSLIYSFKQTLDNDISNVLQYAVDTYDYIFIPNGNYILEKTINISKSILISGQDKFKTTLQCNDGVFNINLTGVWNGFSIKQLTLRSISTDAADVSGNLLYIYAENTGIGENRYGYIENCCFQWGFNGIYASKTALVKIRGCEFYGQTGKSIIMSSDDEVSNCYITASDIGIHIAGGNNRVVNCKIYQNGRNRIAATSDVTSENPAILISGNRNVVSACDIQENYANGIEITGFNNRVDVICDANGYISTANKNGIVISDEKYGGYNNMLNVVACNHSTVIKQDKALVFENGLHKTIANVYAVITEDEQITGMNKENVPANNVVVHNGIIWS